MKYKTWKKQVDEYSAKINDEAIPVHGCLGFEGGTASWLSFEWTQPVTLTVENNRIVDEVQLIPERGASATILNDNEVEVTIDKPGRYYLKINDCFDLPLYIFADPEELDKPDPDDPNVYYFGPGEHDVDPIVLGSNETLYLERGAHVHTSIHTSSAENVTIRGRGCIHAGRIPFRGTEKSGGALIGVNRVKNLKVEGVTFVDSFAGNFYCRNVDHAVLSNVKIICERLYSTDGIMIVNSRDFLVEDCFVRTKDDCITVKGLADRQKPDTWTPVQKVEVSNSLFWSTNNNTIVIGAETRAEVIEDIHAHDCDIICSAYTCGDQAGALAIQSLDDTIMRNVLFENITVHHAKGPLINCYLANEIYGIKGVRNPDGATMDSITFKNITQLAGPPRYNFIRGLDEKRRFTNVRLDNVVIKGQRILQPEDMRLKIEYADVSIS